MKVKKLIIHHSLTNDGQVVDWSAIRKYHIEVNGWDDIGYHWGIERVGDKYVLQTGRPETMLGAHTIGMNDKSLGVCVVGNYDLYEPPEAVLNRLADLCALKCKEYNLRPEDIHPHNEYAPKTCPGTKFPMMKLRQMVARKLGGV